MVQLLLGLPCLLGAEFPAAQIMGGGVPRVPVDAAAIDDVHSAQISAIAPGMYHTHLPEVRGSRRVWRGVGLVFEGRVCVCVCGRESSPE